MGQRPTAMLFHDHFAEFRDTITGEELVEAKDIHWSDWDYALADATRFIQDHTNSHGHLVWEYEDAEKVDVIVERKIDRHDAAVEARTSGKNYNKQKGEYFVSRLELYPWVEERGETWPTVDDYYNKLDSQQTPSED